MSNNKKVYTLLGASSHSKGDRQEDDYYATHPIAVTMLKNICDKSNITLSKTIFEPCVGGGHLAYALEDLGHNIIGYDIINRGYKKTIIKSVFDIDKEITCDVVTNPPYKHATEMVYKLLDHMKEGSYLCMFLRTLFLESKERYDLFSKYPPLEVAISSARIKCEKNGDFDTNSGASAQSFSWFIWKKGYKGTPKLSFHIVDTKGKVIGARLVDKK